MPSQAQAGARPSIAAVHRPRYQEVTPTEPEFDDTWDDQDDYVESSDDFLDSDPQKLSEDQSYHEHVKAVRHFMGWQVPDVDPPIKEPSNPLWTLTSPLAGRFSVRFPVDLFVVERMKKLNRTIATGYLPKNNGAVYKNGSSSKTCSWVNGTACGLHPRTLMTLNLCCLGPEVRPC